ncbi:hypothetical protein [Puniceibacterium confluentis]|uniref:hypothetical protein n=1 Tax=Puniceibacterium confluentis TaxID=1958944 RepID=UPI0011B537B9|nr:hypothetical protein [Puniceibacterium confluentis]
MVISSERFVGEDAADAIRAYSPGADVAVLSTLDEAVQLMTRSPGLIVSLIIAPREGLVNSPLVKLLRDRNGALLVLLSDAAKGCATACRTVAGELPFTNETISGLLDELFLSWPDP